MSVIEQAMNETLGTAIAGGAPPPIWQQRLTARELVCFDHPTDLPCDANSSNPYGFGAAFPGTSQPANPYCDAAGCYVNWDSSIGGGINSNTYGYDLNWSSFHPEMCRTDLIQPYDELRLIQALGRRALRPDRAAATTYFPIYADGFNARAFSNLAAWPVTVVSANSTFADESFPINGGTDPNGDNIAQVNNPLDGKRAQPARGGGNKRQIRPEGGLSRALELGILGLGRAPRAPQNEKRDQSVRYRTCTALDWSLTGPGCHGEQSQPDRRVG